MAVFTTQTLGIAITPASGAPPISQAVSLRPGLQEVAFDAPAPAGVTLAPGAAPLALRWATLRAAAGPASPPVARAITGVLTLRVESAAQGATVETRLLRVDTRAPDRRADRAVIDIYRPGSGAEADHYGYWAFALTAGASTLRAPLAGGPAARRARRGPAARP